MTQLFGFEQFDFPGRLAVADGRYLARTGGADSEQSVLVIETLSAAPLPGRRRRRPRAADPGAGPPELPLSRATAVRAAEPFEDAGEAERWLRSSLESEQAIDALLAEGVGLLNRALHAQAVAGADPLLQELAPQSAVVVRIGYGSGEEVAGGRYTAADRVDVWALGASRRQQRIEELRPQERMAGVLGGRERIEACETLLLRARADIDASRMREAALQLRVALEALLVELDGAVADPGHAEDMATLASRRGEVAGAAGAALKDELDEKSAARVIELTEICERVVRRRRVLRG